MGCFSYICKKSKLPITSKSFGGDKVHLFLLKDGKVLEHMYGEYDSYGRVFTDKKCTDSFEWKMDWDEVVDLHFNDNPGDGVAAIHAAYYDGVAPTTISDDDPNQGRGDSHVGVFKSDKPFFHKVFG
jgi:hypothetical protein